MPTPRIFRERIVARYERTLADAALIGLVTSRADPRLAIPDQSIDSTFREWGKVRRERIRVH